VLRPRQVARGVELFPARTPTLPPATHTNSYALGEREILLVEPSTPYDDERRAWLEWARGIASRGQRLVALLITHHHVDHVGGAAFLARELGLPIWAHEATASRLPELGIQRHLADGEALRLEGVVGAEWTVLHTPGHAPGHVCLLNAEHRTLVVGDMVATVGTILIEPGDGDMRAYLAQLTRLASLDARVVLPAHGHPIDEPAAHFRHYVAHRLDRERKTLMALDHAGDEGAELEALMPMAYADTPRAVWPLARLSLLAHLEKLELDGLALRKRERWVRSSRR
jgi:glyoxylase-like metal-dependent hydrolase (beta-lactamase superfamily II)